jgi:hypothetical protein
VPGRYFLKGQANYTRADAIKTGLVIIGPPHHPSQGFRVEKDPETGLPVVIAVANAPGSAMTLDKPKRLEQDTQHGEDLQLSYLPSG